MSWGANCVRCSTYLPRKDGVFKHHPNPTSGRLYLQHKSCKPKPTQGKQKRFGDMKVGDKGLFPYEKKVTNGYTAVNTPFVVTKATPKEITIEAELHLAAISHPDRFTGSLKGKPIDTVKFADMKKQAPGLILYEVRTVLPDGSGEVEYKQVGSDTIKGKELDMRVTLR